MKTRNGGGYITVLTQTGKSSFPFGRTTLEGDLCYIFSPDTHAVRADFILHPDNDQCPRNKQSDKINPCQVSPICSISPLSDVTPDHPAYNEITSLVNAGIISGYTDGTFKPDDPITRGQLTKITVLALGLKVETAGGPHFKDVPQGSPFYDYVETLHNRGIIAGYKDGTFRPDDKVTRGQLAKVTVMAAGLTLTKPEKPSFRDVAPASDLYSYIETAYAHGMLTPYEDGTFRPEASASRAHGCIAIVRSEMTP